MSSLVLTSSFVMLQDNPSSDPVDQGDEDVWETLGATAERSVSPPPATEEAVPGAAQLETGAVESRVSVGEGQGHPPAAAVEQPEEALAKAETASEARIVNIASILGAPTVTVLQSTLHVL
jgi:hypothetical protein